MKMKCFVGKLIGRSKKNEMSILKIFFFIFSAWPSSGGWTSIIQHGLHKKQNGKLLVKVPNE